MRNHDEKIRDIARSVLPSSGREGARWARAKVHRRERARVRSHLHELGRLADPDDFEGDLTWEDRRSLNEMMWRRREADKVGPLIRWATRTVTTDPVLRNGDLTDRINHFRRLLPDNLIGRHAVSHLAWALDPNPRWPASRRGPSGLDPTTELRAMVTAIIAAGRHGELNDRLDRELDGLFDVEVIVPSHRVIDDDNPPPGRLVPRHRIVERHRRSIRFLAGAHEIDSFVADTLGRRESDVVKTLHNEIVRRPNTPA